MRDEDQLSIIVLYGSTNDLIKVSLANFLFFVHKGLNYVWEDSKNTMVAREAIVEQDQSNETPNGFTEQFFISAIFWIWVSNSASLGPNASFAQAPFKLASLVASEFKRALLLLALSYSIFNNNF